MAVPAWAGLVLLEPPSLCRRLFDDEVAGAGLERLLELARPRLQSESKVLGNSVRFSGHSAEGEGDLRSAMFAVAPSGTGEVQKEVGLGKVIPHT